MTSLTSTARSTVVLGAVLSLFLLAGCSLERKNRSDPVLPGSVKSSSNAADSDEDGQKTRLRVLGWPGNAVGGIVISVPKSPPEMAQLFNSCLRLIWLRQYDKAEDQASRTLAAARKTFGAKSFEQRQALRMLAYIKLNQAMTPVKESADTARVATPGKPVVSRFEGSAASAAKDLMEQQYSYRNQSSSDGVEQFRDAREMADFYAQIVHDENAAEKYFEQAILATRAASPEDFDRRDLLYVVAMLGHIKQHMGKLAEAEPYYQRASILVGKVCKPEDPIAETVAKERGLLAFKLRKPKQALELLYPLAVSPHTVAQSRDYKIVLFCGLIAAQVTGDSKRHAEIADGMVKFSERTYGKGSPQHQFALAEANAASTSAGKGKEIDNQKAYENALAELAQAEQMESQMLARQMSPANSESKTSPTRNLSTQSSRNELAGQTSSSPPSSPAANREPPALPYGQ